MTERQNLIIEGVITEYVKTAKPVGSQAVLNHLNFEISPATIRNEMQILEEAGYLYQPHPSAGRVPTDKGYRHYVDRLRQAALGQNQRQNLEQELHKLMKEYHQLTRSASYLLAKMSRLVTMCSAISSGETNETGLTQLLNQPDSDLLDTIREVSLLLDDPDEVTQQLSDQANETTTIYIGQENPFYPAKHTSLLVRSVDTPRYGRLVFMIAGPKRMSYQSHVTLLDSISDILQNKRL
jgi:heat-inducible transcriptional repressor